MWLVLIEVEINGIKTRLEIYKLKDNITNLGIEDEQSGRSSGRSVPAMTTRRIPLLNQGQLRKFIQTNKTETL